MLDFPDTPTVGQIYTSGGRSWTWNGETWDVVSSGGGDGPQGPPTVFDIPLNAAIHDNFDRANETPLAAPYLDMYNGGFYNLVGNVAVPDGSFQTVFGYDPLVEGVEASITWDITGITTGEHVAIGIGLSPTAAANQIVLEMHHNQWDIYNLYPDGSGGHVDGDTYSPGSSVKLSVIVVDQMPYNLYTFKIDDVEVYSSSSWASHPTNRYVFGWADNGTHAFPMTQFEVKGYTASLDANINDYFLVNVGGNVKLELVENTIGVSDIIVELRQDSVGGHEVALPDGVNWFGFPPLVSTEEDAITIHRYLLLDGIWHGFDLSNPATGGGGSAPEEKRHDYVDGTPNSFDYIGRAPEDSLTSDLAWIITRLTITPGGASTTAVATGVAWDDHLTATYL